MVLVRIATPVLAAILAFAAIIRQPALTSIPYESRDRTNAAALRRHVVELTRVPRSADHPEGLAAAARYIERHFRASGARVELQEFDARKRRYRNVIARFGPNDGPLMIVGAHYDAFGALPGADDNASGTAGVIELVRDTVDTLDYGRMARVVDGVFSAVRN